MITHHHHKHHHPVITAVVVAIIVVSSFLPLPTSSSSSTAAGRVYIYATNNRTTATTVPPPSVVPLPPCAPGQAAALLRLKRSFAATAASTAAFASWRPGTDCCRWHGVRCGGGHGHHGNNGSRASAITSLDLAERGLRSAALHPAIFSLTSLRYLNLACNDFGASELPSAGFERLADLTHLNLSKANLSGTVPAAIGRLVNLVSLDLSVPVSSPRDMFVATDDAAAGHDDNNDDGMDDDDDDDDDGTNTLQRRLVVPNFESFVSKLSNLRELRLDFAAISMSEQQSEQRPAADADLWCSALAMHTPHLRVLTLPCSLWQQPDQQPDRQPSICRSFSRLTSLAILDLRLNGLSGPVPDFFANLSSLRVLQLSDNNLQGPFPSTILQKATLETVDLSRNVEITGSLPSRFPVGSRLKRLLLRDTSFSGEIPSSIANLRSLQELDLAQQAGVDFSEMFSSYGPGFSGTLPSSIGELGSLELLSLSGFELVGSISPWIGNLASLKVLELSNCGLSGPIPSALAGLKKLERVTLSNCNFSGTVQLSWFLGLPNLSVLSLSNNNLFVVDGEDDSSSLVHRRYPRIKSVGLSSCGIEEFPKLVRHLVGPSSDLDISQNRIQGLIPQWAMENWSGLHFQYLNLSHNNFTGFGGFSQSQTFLPFSVDRLDLSYNMFQGPIPLPRNLDKGGGGGGGGGAWELDYSSNMFSSMPPLNFSIRASIFRASRNSLSGSSILASSFRDAVNLEVLDLSYNNLSGPIPSCLMEGGELHVLILKKNRLHGELPRNINGGCSLEILDVGDNEIKGKLPRSLAACSNLTILDVQNNQISDCFPCWMSTLVRLTVLVLRSNEFFGQVGRPSTAEDRNSCGFPSVKILDLASNSFSGTLTEEWLSTLMSMMGNGGVYEEPPTIVAESDSDRVREVYQITVELTYKGSDFSIHTVSWTLIAFLDVSNNNLQGSIPAAIGRFLLLNMLNMSHNSLTGPIPSGLGNLTQLEALDLSSNQLSGEIPRELASLDFLAMLNLSDNRLVGGIPESPHFLTFSNGSFLGNVGLCGPPLSKECINNTRTTPTTNQSVAQHHSSKKDSDSVDIMLFLFSGIGFGVGFAITIVLAWGIPVIRRRS